MKVALTLFVSIVFIQITKAQSIRDSVFNDVILIRSEIEAGSGNKFHMNIPSTTSEKTIIVYNADKRIPNDFFFNRKTFLYPQDEIILVTPDWEYIASTEETRRSTQIHLTPLRQIRMYQIDRCVNKIDSVIADELDPQRPLTFNFALTAPPAWDFSLVGRWEIAGYHCTCTANDTLNIADGGRRLIFDKYGVVRNNRGIAGIYALHGDSLFYYLGKDSFYYRILPVSDNKRRITFVPVTNRYEFASHDVCATIYEQFDTAGRVVHGVVVTDENKGIPNASIRIKGTKTVVLTDKDGRFHLEAQKYDVIEIGQAGFISQEVVITANNEYLISLQRKNQQPIPRGKYKRQIRRELRKHGYYKFPD